MAKPTPSPRRHPLVTLERFGRATAWLPAHWRLSLFWALPRCVRDAAWGYLAEREEAAR